MRQMYKTVYKTAAMSTLGERVREAREAAELSQTELARRIGIKQPSLSAIEQGGESSGRKHVLGTKHILAIAKNTGFRPEYLQFGEPPKKSAVNYGRALDAATDPATVPRGGTREGDSRPDHDGNMATIDELDVMPSAGDGANVESASVLRSWVIPKNVVSIASESQLSRIKIVRVKGDSMSPSFNPLDRLMVDTDDTTPSPAGIFIVWDGLGLVVKRVQYIPHSDPPRVRMASDNPKYEPYERIIGEAYIQGRVIGKWMWT